MKMTLVKADCYDDIFANVAIIRHHNSIISIS